MISVRWFVSLMNVTSIRMTETQVANQISLTLQKVIVALL